LIIACAAAGGAVLIKRRAQAAAASDEQDRRLDDSSRLLSPRGQLPTVAEADRTDFGVLTPAVPLPYIERDLHRKVQDGLVDGRSLLVRGHSMSGKTRLAYEVLRRAYDDWHVWIPERPDGLATLLSDAVPQHAVVWLDDLEAFLRAEKPLRLSWLTLLQEAGCRIIATIRDSEYETFAPIGEVRSPQWAVLQRFVQVRLDEDQSERDRLAEAVGDERLAAGIRRYGIGEYVGGGYLAIDRYNTGKATHRLAIAILRVAVDWRRLGFDVIPESTLLVIAQAYLPAKIGEPIKEDTYAALDWASAEIGGGIRLLEPANGGWRAFDYLLDHLTELNAPIPEPTWNAAIRAVDGSERAFTLARRAYDAHRRMDAVELLRQAAGTLAEAGFALGVVLGELGRPSEAVAVYDEVLERYGDDPDPALREHVARALINKAITLGRLDRPSEAVAVCDQVLERYGDDPDPALREHVAKALVCKGLALSRQDDLAGAAAAWRLANGRGDHHAAELLGVIEQLGRDR
jgi:tetratricopeptide (TPR) repeat protein